MKFNWMFTYFVFSAVYLHFCISAVCLHFCMTFNCLFTYFVFSAVCLHFCTFSYLFTFWHFQLFIDILKCWFLAPKFKEEYKSDKMRLFELFSNFQFCLTFKLFFLYQGFVTASLENQVQVSVNIQDQLF